MTDEEKPAKLLVLAIITLIIIAIIMTGLALLAKFGILLYHWVD